MGSLGATELIIIAVVIILLFGAKKLPDMARSIGRSAKILKAETKGLRDEDDQSQANPATTAQQQPPVAPAPQQLPPAQPPVAQPQVVQPQVAQPIEKSAQNLENKQNSN
ncbi:Sec-independent protein translocase subunit TatA [Saccharothrix hoggarensis]|uniref:Sec-independent protein translocase protein TatA n=1 Tax=Saccharothrix hoggarensis TaxID=913853 RepID=A0ABW3R548_9PSEU